MQMYQNEALHKNYQIYLANYPEATKFRKINFQITFSPKMFKIRKFEKP